MKTRIELSAGGDLGYRIVDMMFHGYWESDGFRWSTGLNLP